MPLFDTPTLAHTHQIVQLPESSVSAPAGLVSSDTYHVPLRPRIVFKNHAETLTNYVFDGFATSNDINVIYADTEYAIGETGIINVIIEDAARSLDETKLNYGNSVTISIGKNSSQVSDPNFTFLIGYVKKYKKIRSDTNVLEHHITALGSKIVLGEAIVNWKKSAGLTSTEDPQPIQTDVRFNSNVLLQTMLEDDEPLPLGGPLLINRGNFDDSGISNTVKTNVAAFSFALTEASNVFDNITDISGARWFIDYSQGTKIIRVNYPVENHTGITVKSGELWAATDNANVTSYFVGSWDAEGDITRESGYANRLYSRQAIDRKVVASSFTNQGSFSLTNKAVGQQFFTTENRITDLAFVLSKIGDPSSPKDRINGRLIADSSNKPEGQTIAEFHIPLGDVETEPTTIFVNDLGNVKNRFLRKNDLLWVVLYQRSGTDGDPNTDETNAIRWHHNNDTSTTKTTYSGIAPGGDKDANLTWTTSNTTSPTMAFGVFANIRHLQEVSDRHAITRHGVVEAVVDTSFLDDSKAIQTYMDGLIQYTARPRLVFQINSVTCPDNFLFRPYQMITIQDTLAFPAGTEAELQRVRYVFGGEGNTKLGCNDVEIQPTGFADWLDDDFTCS